jgi:predicted XRE-type DNA-binding protein
MNEFLNDRRLSRKEVAELYGVDKSTIENWVKKLGLPLISLTTHSKYIRMKDLVKWENSFLKPDAQ